MLYLMDIPLLDPLVPEPAQEEAIQRIVTEPTRAALNAAQTGTGKTLIAVEVARRLGVQRIMISAPLHTHESWMITINRQFRGEMPIRVISNKNKAGREARSQFEWGMPGVYLIGREQWRLDDWTGMETDLLIHDECHSLSNHTSKGSKKARRLTKGWLKAGFVLMQSATPFGATFTGAWSIGRALWPDLIDSVRVRWEMEHCSTQTDWAAVARQKAAVKAGTPGAEFMTTTKVVGETRPGEFVNSLPCYVYLPSTQGEPREVEIHVDLTRAQRKIYDDLEAKGVAWLGEHPLVPELPITERIRLRQVTLGECEISEDGSVGFNINGKSAKLDTLVELLADLQGEKVLIATDSAKYARIVAQRIGGFAWTGDVTSKERDAAKDRFINGSLQYIVATQAAISEGTDGLQHVSNIMVVLSLHDQNLLNTQMLGRLNRKGQTKRVIVYRIIARNTLDDPQATTLLARELKMRMTLAA